MAIDLKQQKQGFVHLAVQDEMTIYTAQQHKQALFEHLCSARQLQIELAGVSEIDSAGVQVLMFLKQEAINRDIKLSLTQHSQAVIEAFELLNLGTFFGDPMVIPAERKSP